MPLNRRVIWIAVPLVMTLMGAACATSFSPRTIRDEIARQTGQDPQTAFEFTLGRPTMALAKALMGGVQSEGPLPFAGLTSFELAVYGVPQSGADLDFTRMPVRGWDPVVKARKAPNSAFVLIRPTGDAIGDLVLVAGGTEQVLYARLRGRLSRELPEALGQAVTEGGPDSVKRQLMAIPEEPR